MNYDFLIIGAGIFGLSAAIELRKRKHRVGVLNPVAIPDPRASSTDISKVVRMEYGSDQEYFEMARLSIEGWKAWNEILGEKLYYETGFLLLCRQSMDSGHQQFERSSYQHLLQNGFAPRRMDGRKLFKDFPVFREGVYQDGFYNPAAGFALSGRTLTLLADYARSLGVEIQEGQTADHFEVREDRLLAVRSREGQRFEAGQVVVCAGAHTPFLVPGLQDCMSITGHPVFHLRPKDPALFTPPRFSVFAADISNTGWYGFPLHPREGVVKIARHSDGLVLHPDRDERRVTEQETDALRQFLREALPALSDAEVVYTRRCLYTDTRDGHFWIDRHPEIRGLSVATGGSGHGFKMGPEIGKLIADVAEQGRHQWTDRYGWRKCDQSMVNTEEARNKNK